MERKVVSKIAMFLVLSFVISLCLGILGLKTKIEEKQKISLNTFEILNSSFYELS